jgi:hypothetical protein
MSNPSQPKADGANQKRTIVNTITETVAGQAGLPDATDLPLHKASVAAAVYHYTVGVYRSSEIAGRVKIDPAFGPWRKHGAPSAEDICRVRDEQPELLRRCLVEALGWSWNVPLRRQVTGEATIDYTEKVIAGRQEQFKSQGDVEAEADKRIAAAAAADLDSP